MPKFIFAYHGGGKMPEDKNEYDKVMAAWGAWFEKLGDAVVDVGNPAGPSTTVTGNGVENNGGANPISGYSLIQAATIDEAVEMARGCPVLAGGTIEIAEAIEIQM